MARRFAMWGPSDAESTFARMVKHWWPRNPCKFVGLGGRRFAVIFMWRVSRDDEGRGNELAVQEFPAPKVEPVPMDQLVSQPGPLLTVPPPTKSGNHHMLNLMAYEAWECRDCGALFKLRPPKNEECPGPHTNRKQG